MNINEKLREVIESRGIKQSYVCGQTGISADTLSKILNSNRKITADEFLSICDALKVDPRYFAKSA